MEATSIEVYGHKSDRSHLKSGTETFSKVRGTSVVLIKDSSHGIKWDFKSSDLGSHKSDPESR